MNCLGFSVSGFCILMIHDPPLNYSCKAAAKGLNLKPSVPQEPYYNQGTFWGLIASYGNPEPKKGTGYLWAAKSPLNPKP